MHCSQKYQCEIIHVNFSNVCSGVFPEMNIYKARYVPSRKKFSCSSYVPLYLFSHGIEPRNKGFFEHCC